MTRDELEKNLTTFLAKNPMISTDDIYIESFFNEKEFITFWGKGKIRSFHNLYIHPKNANWCYAICPLKVYPIRDKKYYLSIKERQKSKEHFLHHYKTAIELDKIKEIIFTHQPIVENLETAKIFFNHNRRQDIKELTSIAKKIDTQDEIQFGELVIAQNLINNLEHDDLKYYIFFEYGKSNNLNKNEQSIQK